MKRIIFIILLVIIVGMQFFHGEPNDGQALTEQDINHAIDVPEPVMQILTNSCYDCHSNHTNYPWYSKINPVGWWLDGHVKDGKSELNFSEFATYEKKRQDHKLEEIAEEVTEGHMPIPPYLIMHEEAKLNSEQIATLEDWVNTERQKLTTSSK